MSFQELVVFIDISDIHDEAEKYEYDTLREIVLMKNRRPDGRFRNKEKNVKEKTVSFIKENLVGSYFILNFVHDLAKKIIYSSNEDSLKTYRDKFTSNDNFIKYIASDNYVRDQWTINEDVFEYEYGVNKSLYFMSKLKEICDENNINLTIAVYPMFTQIYHNDIESIQEKIWRNFSKKNNINFINYFPIFIEEGKNMDERLEVIKKYYIPFDLHWNKLGNKVVADHFIKNYKID